MIYMRLILKNIFSFILIITIQFALLLSLGLTILGKRMTHILGAYQNEIFSSMIIIAVIVMIIMSRNNKEKEMSNKQI